MIYPRMQHRSLRRTVALATALALSASVVTACGDGSQPGSQPQAEQAEQEPAKPELVQDVRGHFFDKPKEAVIAADEPDAQFAAARHAVEQGVPMFGAKDAAKAKEAGVKKATTFGDVDAGELEATPGEVTPGEGAKGKAALEKIAGLESKGESPMTVFATKETPLADVASARAAGAKIQVLDAGDPRASKESMEAVQKGNVLAAGPAFGSPEEFQAKLDLADNGELPGGGGLVFPGRRMIALYGHPSGPALGVMGEQDPQAAVERLKPLIEQYQQESEEPVIPAFEIIATVASDSPGPDGDYANEADPQELVPYIDAITEAGGYAVIDLQPGRANLVDQAKLYEDLLKRPNVGLALDPEWKIGPNEQPMTNIGHVEAAEVNEVADWLAQLVRDNDIPQKALVMHQFQLQMIRDREQINTKRPELAFVLHADGHGPTSVKMDTWNVMRQGLSPDYFMAWKNFIDEDTPMLDPAQTFAVEPRPWFVSYQ